MVDRPAVPLTSEDFPSRPYPGTRPEFSFVQDETDAVHPLGTTSWTLGGESLDDWLAASGAVPLAARRRILAYGSNACPGKIAWLRTAHGLPGPVIVVRARCRGLGAVWASGFRVVDDQRPATLAALPGADETHAVWFVAADQLPALDACEGRRAGRYDLAEVHTGTVTLENGERVDTLAYVGADAERRPLLVDGRMVRCADVPQAEARLLAGRPAACDGLESVCLAP